MSQPSSPADGPPLPEMREAVLSRDEVVALQADLLTHTQIQGVLCKAKSREQTPVGNTSLELAIQQLLDHLTAAVQIRYSYDGHEWTDTLLNTPAGVRLVRCQHQRMN